LSLAFAAAVSGCDLGDDPEREPAGAEPRNGSQRDPAAAAGAEPRPLAERLRRGGYVLAFRHAATGSETDSGGDLRDCSRQRNLSAEGRDQARGIASAFERLGIPVGAVLASPYCRTRETARLACVRPPLCSMPTIRPGGARPSAGRRAFGACWPSRRGEAPTGCSSRTVSPSTTPPASTPTRVRP
jgi:hypothetical protein